MIAYLVAMIGKLKAAISSVDAKIAATAIEVTKESAASDIDVVAYKSGNVVTVSGYALIPAGTYGNSDYFFKIPSGTRPKNNIYFFDDQGRIMRVNSSGNAFYHNETTLAGDAFIFFNFSYTLS